jgi:hypothetical protein
MKYDVSRPGKCRVRIEPDDRPGRVAAGVECAGLVVDAEMVPDRPPTLLID